MLVLELNGYKLQVGDHATERALAKLAFGWTRNAQEGNRYKIEWWGCSSNLLTDKNTAFRVLKSKMTTSKLHVICQKLDKEFLITLDCSLNIEKKSDEIRCVSYFDKH